MTSIVLAGVGGQGIVTVGKIIGEAAIFEGKTALMTEIHGMAQRGGRISVDLRIGDYKSAIIPSRSADAIMGFELLESARNTVKLKEDGFILANRRMIHPMPLIREVQDYPVREAEDIISKYNHLYIEADSLAISVGEKRSMNMIMLGAIYATGVLELNETSLIDAIRNAFPNPKTQEINIKAFHEGEIALKREKAL